MLASKKILHLSLCSLILIGLSGCSASRSGLASQENDGVGYKENEGPLSRGHFPGIETLSSWPRIGSGPVEILWDETYVRLDSNQTQTTILRRVYRIWDDPMPEGLDRNLVFAHGTKKARGSIQLHSPDGISEGKVHAIDSDLDKRGRITMHLKLPDSACQGCLIDTKVEAENKKTQGELSGFVNLPDKGPIHRMILRVEVPKSMSLRWASRGLEAKPETNLDGRQNTYLVRLDKPEIPQDEPSAPPRNELQAGFGYTTEKSWAQLGSTLAGRFETLTAATPELKAMAPSPRGGVGDLEIFVEKLQEELEITTDVDLKIDGADSAADILQWGRASPNQANLVAAASLAAAGWDVAYILSRTYGEGPLMAELPSRPALTRLFLEVKTGKTNQYIDFDQEVPLSSTPPPKMDGRLALRVQNGKGALITLPRTGRQSATIKRTIDLLPDPSGRLEFILVHHQTAGGALPDTASWASNAKNARALLDQWIEGARLQSWEFNKEDGEIQLSGYLKRKQRGKRYDVDFRRFPITEIPLIPTGRRQTPVYLGPWSKVEVIVRLHIPEGTKILNMPPDTKLTFRQGSFRMRGDPAFRMVSVNRTVQMDQRLVPVGDARTYVAFLRQMQETEAKPLQARLPQNLGKLSKPLIP